MFAEFSIVRLSLTSAAFSSS